MKKFRQLIRFISFIALATLSACGGSGGGGSTNTQPTSAVITLSTQGTLPNNTEIGGLGLIANFPAGMYVKTDTDGNVDTSVVTASGAASQATVIALYTAATSTAQAKLYVALSSDSASGFIVGEFAKVHCAIMSGSSPLTSGISLSNFEAVDTNGAAISGVTAAFSASIQ